MKKLIPFLAAVAFTFSVATVRAEEKTIKGDGLCAKCALKETKTCQNAIQAKEGDKTVTYYLTGDKSKAFHSNICTEKKPVVAKGTVKEVDGKQTLEVSSIELAK